MQPTASDEKHGSEEQRSTLRIFSWNINGITPFIQRPITTFFTKSRSSVAADEDLVPAASLRDFLRRHQWPEVLGLQEIKIANSDQSTQAAVRRAVNAKGTTGDDGPEYEVHYTLPTSKFNARGWGGKVYGVCSIIRRDFSSKHVKRVRNVSWDDEGRFSVIELHNKLVIWNIYAVNGTDNPYRDSKTGEELGTRHDRKLQVHKLLYEECCRMQNEGHSHVLIGDLNIAPSRIDGHPNLRTFPTQHVGNRADFHDKFLNPDNPFHGIDVWRYMHPDVRKYTYHSRGIEWGSSCDRVDLVVASQQLVSEGRIKSSKIFDSPQERGPSDHVPISVEIDIEDS